MKLLMDKNLGTSRKMKLGEGQEVGQFSPHLQLPCDRWLRLCFLCYGAYEGGNFQKEGCIFIGKHVQDTALRAIVSFH